MRTEFSPAQLADPGLADAAAAVRKCVHCGFCLSACPTYGLLRNELDSPRGRIMLMKDMLEKDEAPHAETVLHVDRCLSCLSCRSTCPSGVDYMRLVDHARVFIEERYRRPWHERATRWLLATVLPHRRRFRVALALAPLGRGLSGVLDRHEATRPLGAMLRLAPRRVPRPSPAPPVAAVAPRGRVAILRGCAEPVLDPAIGEAAERLLARVGFAPVRAAGEGCCGALVHHLGREEAALDQARRNVDAWWREITGPGLAAIVVTTSGCGSVVKDYGHMLREDPAYAERAAQVSALAKDVTELLDQVPLPDTLPDRAMPVAYHPPCSLQHGQRIGDVPARLLTRAGFAVGVPRDAHLCCGSAGTYNILQSDIASKLAVAKAGALEELGAQVVVTSNIGCATQIGTATALPIVHVVQLLDWATGGPDPLSRRQQR